MTRPSSAVYPLIFVAFAARAAAAALLAFVARAVRSAGVIVSSDRLPPILPPLEPCRRNNSRKADRGVSLDAQTAEIRAMAVVQGADLVDVHRRGELR